MLGLKLTVTTHFREKTLHEIEIHIIYQMLTSETISSHFIVVVVVEVVKIRRPSHFQQFCELHGMSQHN